MPLSRYQIRNEYGLADPELYRAADKDDPEALLEGVAMAGLVGVLRQLGDLAEFAAEIFHDLHEEVMATAARGHGLMARVQQLEAEFPSVENSFLTQTDPTPFFTNAGFDWHPNLRMGQNLIPNGDLPRFVMESYEECRGPPRLFLLDKYDVAGAGACLKRYTDPSVFKVEAVSYGVPAVETQREKKNRKVKKKGARLRNGETPEVVPTSHAKLHQLFLEERIENGHSDPARLVKLKRRQFNGFPFDPKPGKSFMEKFLGTPSPERKEVHEIAVNPSPLRLTFNSSDEPALEIVDIGTVSPEKKSSQGWEDASPVAEEAELKPVIPELSEEPFDRELVKVMADESPYFIHEKNLENGLAVDEDRETEGSLDGDGSDEFMSEVDNYVDALTTVESEMETDNDYKPKTDMGFLTAEKHKANSEEHLDVQANSSDSQLTFGNSSVSDDGKSISRKGRFGSSCSDSLSNEHTPSDIGESEIIGSPMDHPSVPAVNQGNESTEQAYIEEDTICTAAKESASIPTVNSTINSSAQTELDDISSDYTEFDSKASYLPDSVASHAPWQTLHTPAEDCQVEESVHKDLDAFVSTVDFSDLEEEVDDSAVNKILVEGDIDSPQSVTSLVSVNEEHQTDYADRACNKDMIEGTVDSTHSVISPSEEQLSSSAVPESNLDSSVTPVSENSDVLTVQINSEVSDGITGIKIKSENLTKTVATPELDTIEEHDLIGGVTYFENAKRLEEISRAINNERMDVEGEDSVLFEHSVHCSDEPSSEPVDLDEHMDESMVNDASCLPSDFIDSNCSDFVNIQEYLGGSESHQNGTDNNRVLPECLMEPEELKVAKQSEVVSAELKSSLHESTSNGSLNPEVLDHICRSDLTYQTEDSSCFRYVTAVPSAESALLALNETSSRTPELLELQYDQHVDETSSKSYDLQSDNTQNVSEMGQGRGIDPSSKQEALPSQELHDAAISRNPFDSAFPSFDLLPENSEEMPPLPPLPPMQWRMGKFQPPSIASQGQQTDLGKGVFSPMQSFINDDRSQFDFPSIGREAAHPPIPIFPLTSDIPESQHLSLESPDNSIQPVPLSPGMPTVIDESSQRGTESSNPDLNIPIATNEKSILDTSSTEATVPTEHGLVSSHGSQTKLVNQVMPEPTLEAKESENSLQNSAVDEQYYVEKSESPPMTSEDQPHHDLVNVHEQIAGPSTLALPAIYEAGKPNGSKLPRPRNPLIDAVAAVDKSKLRKVTERVHPHVAPKADERDSLLEQIRTKSFNLKPAAVARPSIQGIQGPKTNLKVAAILEKANAIRQALTGSDEDEDSDSWSDS